MASDRRCLTGNVTHGAAQCKGGMHLLAVEHRRKALEQQPVPGAAHGFHQRGG
jgi:hypothetical protein